MDNRRERARQHHDLDPSKFYEILGVAPTASADEIRAAYRDQAKRLHPDQNPGVHGAEEKFKALNDAYNVLSDVDKRAAYDRRGNGNNFAEQDDVVQKIIALKETILTLGDLESLKTMLNNWLNDGKNFDARDKRLFQPDSNAVYLSVKLIYDLLHEVPKNARATELLNKTLENASKTHNDQAAAHILKLIRAYKPTETVNHKNDTDEPAHEAKPKQEASQPPTEIIKAKLNELLTQLSGIKSLEEIVFVLQKWLDNQSVSPEVRIAKFSEVIPGEDFTPGDLFTELSKFTLGKYAELSQSALLQGETVLLRGMAQYVKEYLRKKGSTSSSQASTSSAPKNAAAETKVGSKTPQTAVKLESTSSKEIKELRAKIENSTSLSVALQHLKNSTLTEFICFKPPATRSLLTAMLEAIVTSSADYKKYRFFQEAVKAREANDISTVAEKLLAFAEAGK